MTGTGRRKCFKSLTVFLQVRIMRDTATKKPVKACLPGRPVEIAGLRSLPSAGDEFICVNSEQEARQVSEFRRSSSASLNMQEEARLKKQRMREKLRVPRKVAEETQRDDAGPAVPSQATAAQELPLIIKTDVAGSLEAVVDSLAGIPSPEVTVKIAHAAVGPISESDVSRAHALGAKIFGFNTRFQDNSVTSMAKSTGVKVSKHNVIYSLLDEAYADISAMMTPEVRCFGMLRVLLFSV